MGRQHLSVRSPGAGDRVARPSNRPRAPAAAGLRPSMKTTLLAAFSAALLPLIAGAAAPANEDLESPPPGFSSVAWARYSPAVRRLLKHPDYCHHIIAVDEQGSALQPMPQITKFDDHANPIAWKVDYLHFATENTGANVDTIAAGPNKGKPAFRREFIEYLEDVPGHVDGFGYFRTQAGVFENYRRLCHAGAVDHVVIYIHGGLNSIHGAGQKACELTHAILADHAYPIFIVWNSNLPDTYLEHLGVVREGIRSPAFALATSPLQLVADGGTAVARAPMSLVKLLRNDVYHLVPDSFCRYKQARERADNLLQEDASLPPSQVPVFLSGGRPQDDERTADKKALDAASWTFWLGTKAVTTPFIDTLGTSAWFNMIRRTRVMFERESSFVNERLSATLAPQSQREMRWESRCGALRLFFERVQSEFALESGPPPPITIIGHSMGAIITSEALARFEGLPLANVVFMAAACTVNDFKLKVVPYLQHQPSCRFYNLCLHPYNETGEREPYDYVEVTPRGSLLVWIDSLFDNPIAEDDRTMGRWENAILAADWLPANSRGRVTIKGFGRDRRFAPLSDTGVVPFPYAVDQTGPLLIEPNKHGVFSSYGRAVRPDYRFWRPYFWTAEPIREVKDTDTHLRSLRRRSKTSG